MTKSYETFKGVVNWTDDKIAEYVKFGIKEWLKWSFLHIGAFQNVDVAQEDFILGGHPSILRAVSSPNYTDGQVWEGFRGDWVWETGVDYSITPTVCSGVYVDDVFYETASESGDYAHYINFPDGQIIFDIAIDTESEVKTSFCPRLVNVVDSDSIWFTELLYNSHMINREDFLAGTGPCAQLAQSRRTMPLVGVQFLNMPTPKPWALGGGQIFYPNILLHILAENQADLNNLVSILTLQNDKVIYLLDINSIKSGTYPYDLDYRGMTVASPMNYSNLVATYPWARGQIQNMNARNFGAPEDWLYKSVINFNFEIIIENV